MDLLSRLLAFDPTRRASADEALAHEYFSDLLPEDSATLEEASAAQALGGLAGPGVAAPGQQQQQQQQQQQAGSGLTRPRSANSARLLPPLPPRQASAGRLNGAGAMQQAPSAANTITLAGPFAAVTVAPPSTSAASSEHGLPLGHSFSGDMTMADVASSRESSPPLGRVAAGSAELPPLPAFAPSAEIPPPPGAPLYWNEPNPGKDVALCQACWQPPSLPNPFLCPSHFPSLKHHHHHQHQQQQQAGRWLC